MDFGGLSWPEKKWFSNEFKGEGTGAKFPCVHVGIAMLGVMGLPFSVIVFFATVTYFIWRAVQRSDSEDSRRIFEFYVRANDILREAAKRWSGFEIASGIVNGEAVVRSMIGSPTRFPLGLGGTFNMAA